MNKRYKVYALVGPSGCGKDTILKRLLKKYNKTKMFNHIVSYTSRPRREGEKDGVTYHYVKPEFFIGNKSMVEMAVFNDWYYGTTLSCYDKDKINTFYKAQYRVIYNLIFQNETSPLDPLLDNIIVHELKWGKINGFQKGLHYKNN